MEDTVVQQIRNIPVIDLLPEKDADHQERSAEIPTVIGACTPGYTPEAGKRGLERHFLTMPYAPGKDAAVWGYCVLK